MASRLFSLSLSLALLLPLPFPVLFNGCLAIVTIVLFVVAPVVMLVGARRPTYSSGITANEVSSAFTNSVSANLSFPRVVVVAYSKWLQPFHMGDSS